MPQIAIRTTGQKVPCSCLGQVNKDDGFQGKLYFNHCSEFEQPQNKKKCSHQQQ